MHVLTFLIISIVSTLYPKDDAMEPYQYFSLCNLTIKKKYDALRTFFFEKKEARVVAENYGYTLAAFYSLTKDFRKHLKENPEEDYFFKNAKKGRQQEKNSQVSNKLIIDLRKQNFSTEDIVGIINGKGNNVSYGYVYTVLKNDGFAKLPRRGKAEKKKLKLPKIKAPSAGNLELQNEKFYSHSTGVFIFLPFIKQFGIDTVIKHSKYPETKAINRLSSILSFLALKISNIRRYSCDDIWCMDRGLGLFAALNVLPKSGWLSSYSSRITRDMNVSFLKELHAIWKKKGLLSDTSNLDFTTIPYWGDGEHLENNWSGKRNKGLSSMLSVLAQDPDSGIINYGDTNVMHKNESSIVLEYLDFYKDSSGSKGKLQYLIFDSKFTNYQNLSKLDDDGIKFITIRKRGRNIVKRISSITDFKTIRVEASGLKKRTIKVKEEVIKLRGYYNFDQEMSPKLIRQIIITGHGKMKPALIITNDFTIEIEKVVKKYCRRWLVEKGISEQVTFFHLNRVSSSMVIKVDFDFTMTILAHNLYRLLSNELERYANLTDVKIYEKFIANNGTIQIKEENINIELKKKRDLPQILELLDNFKDVKYDWLEGKKITFYPSSTS